MISQIPFDHPHIDCDNHDLYQELSRFCNHVGFVFNGPLNKLKAEDWKSRMDRNMYRSTTPRNLQDARLGRRWRRRPSKSSRQIGSLRTTAKKKQAHRKAQTETTQTKANRSTILWKILVSFLWTANIAPWWHSDWFDHWWSTGKEASTDVWLDRELTLAKAIEKGNNTKCPRSKYALFAMRNLLT